MTFILGTSKVVHVCKDCKVAKSSGCLLRYDTVCNTSGCIFTGICFFHNVQYKLLEEKNRK